MIVHEVGGYRDSRYTATMDCELCDEPLVAIYITEEVVGFCNTSGCPAMRNSIPGHEAYTPVTWSNHYLISIGFA